MGDSFWGRVTLKPVVTKLVCVKLVINLWRSAPPEKTVGKKRPVYAVGEYIRLLKMLWASRRSSCSSCFVWFRLFVFIVVLLYMFDNACWAEGALTHDMRVCAKHRRHSYGNSSWCVSATPSYSSSVGNVLPPGGNVTIHFNQLVVANVITIRRVGFLTLCEVDVRGTTVVFLAEG